MNEHFGLLLIYKQSRLNEFLGPAKKIWTLHTWRSEIMERKNYMIPILFRVNIRLFGPLILIRAPFLGPIMRGARA